MTHICFSKLTIIGSDNGLSPDRRQPIIWTNAGLLLIGPSGTNFSEILIEILTFSFKKMRLKVSSAKRRPFCLGLNVLRVIIPWLSVWLICCHRSSAVTCISVFQGWGLLPLCFLFIIFLVLQNYPNTVDKKYHCFIWQEVTFNYSTLVT